MDRTTEPAPTMVRARVRALVLAGLLLPWAHPALGQTAPGDSLPVEPPADAEGVEVRGWVADVESGRPLPAASIRVVRLGEAGRETLAWAGSADSTGVFGGPRLAPGAYRLEAGALGYRPAAQDVGLSGYGAVEVQVELSPEALELEPIFVVTRRRSVLERNGFYDRRSGGFGHTLDRAEIEARRPRRVTDLLRTLPGVTVGPGTLGRGGSVRMRGGCSPDVVVDGVKMLPDARLDDILTVSNLEAVEVYPAAMGPARFSRSSCGTVLVWTRDPTVAVGEPTNWKRIGIVAGFFVFGFVLGR